MFFSNRIIEFYGKDKIKIFEINSNSVTEKNLELLSKQKLNRLKHIKILICGEQIYIKIFIFPKVTIDKLDVIIRDELKNYFSIKKDIIFSFEVLEKDEEKIKVKVYFIKEEIFQRSILNNNEFVEAIYLVQFIFNDIVRRITLENVVICAKYNENFYFIYSEKGSILKNSITTKNISIDKEINKFINMNRIENLKKIFFIGLQREQINSINLQCDFQIIEEADESSIINRLK